MCRARDNQLVAISLDGVVVVVTIRKLLNDTAFHIQFIDLVGGFLATDEIDGLAVLAPGKAGGILVEIRAVILRGAALEIVNHQTVFFRLKAVGFHVPPDHLLAVGGDYRVHVVTFVEFRQVLRDFCLQVVEVNISVGTLCELLACQLLTAIYELAAIGKPSHLLHATKRRVRTVELLILQQIHGVVHGGVVNHDKMTVSAVGPVVPVAVHEVVVDHSVSLGQVGIAVFDGLLKPHVLEKADVLHIRCIAEPVDVALHSADGFGVFAIGVGLPDLRAHVVGAEEGDLLAVRAPNRLHLVFLRHGDTRGFAARGRHRVKFRVAFVDAVVVIGHRVEQRLPVGRHLHLAQTSEIPKDFLIHHALRKVGRFAALLVNHRRRFLVFRLFTTTYHYHNQG